MNERRVWILARVYELEGEPMRWTLEDAFDSEEEALAAANDERDTIGSIPFGVKLPDPIATAADAFWAVERRPELRGVRA